MAQYRELFTIRCGALTEDAADMADVIRLLMAFGSRDSFGAVAAAGEFIVTCDGHRLFVSRKVAD